MRRMRPRRACGSHPTTRNPIDLSQLMDEIMRVIGRGNIPWPPIDVALTKALANEHLRNCRRYAQVYTDVRPIRFEFAPNVLWLPRKYRLGLIAHEIGHVLAPDAGEAGADRAARKYLRVAITYDKRNFPGKGLQVGRLVR